MSPSRTAGIAGAVALVVAIVALAALGSRAVSVPDGKSADTSQVAQRFAIAAGIAAIGALAIVGGLVMLARRNPSVASLVSSDEQFRARPFIARAIPWAIAVVALAGVLGAATAPLRDESELAKTPGTGGQQSDPSRDSFGGEVAPDLPVIEGAIIRDEFGREQIQGDLDSDGRLDSSFTQCPEGTPNDTNRVPGGVQDDGSTLVPIDDNCDGTVDGYIRLRSLEALDQGDAPLDPNQQQLGGGAPPAEAGADRLGGGNTNWGTLALVVLIGIVVLAIVAVALNRLLATDEETEEAVDELVADPVEVSVGASLDLLNEDHDPRRGIIAAYSHLLNDLAANGLSRRTHEGPEEYIRRCCESLGVNEDPLVELTELFTVARFSSHEMTTAHHDAARRALSTVGTDLATRRSLVGASTATAATGSLLPFAEGGPSGSATSSAPSGSATSSAPTFPSGPPPMSQAGDSGPSAPPRPPRGSEPPPPPFVGERPPGGRE